MTNQKILENKTKLEEICRANIVGAKTSGPCIYVPLPQSEREAENLAYFWHPVFKENKNEIKEISFAYQEKDKELPLSYPKKLFKSLGFKIKPKTKEGEIGNLSVSPELIRYENGQKYVNVITKKEDWTLANKLAQKSNTFSAPFVLLPKNLCYQVNIPLECIKSIEFKGDFY